MNANIVHFFEIYHLFFANLIIVANVLTFLLFFLRHNVSGLIILHFVKFECVALIGFEGVREYTDRQTDRYTHASRIIVLDR